MGGKLTPEAQRRVENMRAALRSDEFAEMSPEERLDMSEALGMVRTDPDSLTSRAKQSVMP